jgi:molecular chaperone HtpG
VLADEAEGSEFRINGVDISGGMSYADIMELGSELFNVDFIDFIPLESPGGHFSGVAYILPYSVTPYNKTSHRIYLKNMLLTTDGSMILPRWAFFVKCFLNTTTLRPTASRENFYKDDELEEAKKEIAQCISRYFVNLSKRNSQMLRQIVQIHAQAIQSVATEDDELFKIFIPHLMFESSLGSITGRQIIKHGEPAYYTNDVNQYKQLEPFFRAQMRLLVNVGYVNALPLVEKIREFYEGVDIQPIREEGLAEFLNDISAREDDEAEFFLKIAGFVLDEFDCEPQIKRFHPTSQPVLYFIDESTVQAREISENINKGDFFAGMLSGFAEEYEDCNRPVLYFNINNPLIKNVLRARDAGKLRTVTEMLYVQSLLSGRFPVQGEELDLLNRGILKLLKGDFED